MGVHWSHCHYHPKKTRRGKEWSSYSATRWVQRDVNQSEASFWNQPNLTRSLFKLDE